MKSSPFAGTAPVSVAALLHIFHSLYTFIIMATLSLAFHPGQLVQTSRIFDASCEHQPFFSFVRSCIARHLRGDWGDCCEQDQDSNEMALQGGGRLFSAYPIPAGVFVLESKIWIITEADRSYTTVLFPSEY
jgi:hypothetical protein